jgi:hypothetical protein
MASGIALGLLAATTAVSTIGQLQQASAQQSMYDYQAEMSKKQGELAELQARQEAAEVTKQEVATKSKQRAQAAAAGIDLSSGSFMDILNDTATKAQSEREDILRRGALNKASYDAESSGYSAASSSTGSGKWWKAGATLLSGAAQGVDFADRRGWFDD